ncbi:MAG: VOC family protein [Hyphomicrobiales bacterium]
MSGQAYRVTGLLTVVHAVSDFDRANVWYTSVLGARPLFSKPHPHARGMAARHALADATIEPISSEDPTSNIARVCARYGERLYSTAWLVDDLDACYQTLSARGIRVFTANGAPLAGPPGADAFFTHPRDTYGTLEFASAARHETGEVPGPGHIVPPVRVIYLVPDPVSAARLYGGLLGVTDLDETAGDAYRGVLGTTSSGHALEFREPVAGADLRSRLESRGVGPWGLRLTVGESAAFRRRLGLAGVALADGHGVFAAEQLGVRFEFEPARPSTAIPSSNGQLRC